MYTFKESYLTKNHKEPKSFTRITFLRTETNIFRWSFYNFTTKMI